MILPREWETLNNFSSLPIGTGPYAVIRYTNNQLKIHAFDDYFGYRALIDEVNVWVLPDIGEEPGGGLTLKGPTEDEKAIERRLEEGCYYLLLDARSQLKEIDPSLSFRRSCREGVCGSYGLNMNGKN